MKLIVLSDVHRYVRGLDRILDFNPDRDMVLSLGDSELPSKELEKRNIIAVKGNYPFDPGIAYDHVVTVFGHKIFMTHGHRYGVRRGIDEVVDAAKKQGCTIALYGHTHLADVQYKDGIYIFNPGSVYRSRNQLLESYLVLELTELGFEYSFKEVETNKNIVL